MSTTLTATAARQNFFQVIQDSVRKHREYHITSPAGEVVLLSLEDYESLLETLHLRSIPGFLGKHKKARKEIADGKTYDLDEVL